MKDFQSGGFESKALDALDWAREAGYECLRAKGETLTPESLKSAELPYVWNEVRADALNFEARGFNVAQGKPCFALVDNGTPVVQMLFSTQRDLFTEEVEWLPVAVGGESAPSSRIRDIHSLASQRFNLDIAHSEDVTEVREPCLYIRVPENFGHFALDFLTTLFTAIHFFPELASLPLAMAQLRDDQRRLLSAFGYGQDRLLILETPKNQKSWFRLETAYAPSSGRNPLGYSLLQERAAALEGLALNPGSRRLFLSRRNFRPRHRIANEEEIEALLLARGFDILCPETLDPLDVLSRVREAEMILLPFGAGNGHLAMAPQTCQILMLAPEFLVSDQFDSARLRIQRSYLLPFFNRIHFVAGQPETNEGQAIGQDGKLSWDLAVLNAPHIYSVRAVDQAILNAEKCLAWFR
jgi:hypothetical protein